MKDISLERLVTIGSVVMSAVMILGYFVSFGEWKSKVNTNVLQTEENKAKDKEQDEILQELIKTQTKLVTIIEILKEDRDD